MNDQWKKLQLPSLKKMYIFDCLANKLISMMKNIVEASKEALRNKK